MELWKYAVLKTEIDKILKQRSKLKEPYRSMTDQELTDLLLLELSLKSGRNYLLGYMKKQLQNPPVERELEAMKSLNRLLESREENTPPKKPKN